MTSGAHLRPVPDPVPTDEVDGSRPLRPGDDPFYAPPRDLAAHAPGTVLRRRRVRLGFLGLVRQRHLVAWQLAYRSTDLEGRPELAVTTVVVPRRRPRGQEPRLIAYQCAIDAVSDRCFPSYALRPGARAWGALPQFELIFISALLERGYAVSIADHEGRGGYFAAPREPGYRVLDGVRAALSIDELELAQDTPIGLFGYSGGGMATSWAAEMAPHYAPELQIVGAVLGSPVGDPGEAFLKLNETLNAGFPALVVSGLRHVYPGLDRVLREHASVEGLRRLDRLEEMSTVEAVVRHAFHDFDDYLDAPLADVLATPEVLAVFDDLRLGQHIPECPLLVVQAMHDRIIDVDDVDSQVERYRRGGGRVLYLRDHLSEHISLMMLAMPVMLDWLAHRFAGDEAPEGERTALSLALDVRAVPGFARLGGSLLRTLFGRIS